MIVVAGVVGVGVVGVGGACAAAIMTVTAAPCHAVSKRAHRHLL